MFPVQQLDMRALTVKEDENFTAGGLPAELGCDQATDHRSSFAIAVTLIKIVAVRGVQAEHQYR